MLSNEDLIIEAITRIRANKGIDTEGVDKHTIDGFNTLKIVKLSNQLKTQTYQWKPGRRIRIPKPGKTAERPLGISFFTDKIVEEMIRMILESISTNLFSK